MYFGISVTPSIEFKASIYFVTKIIISSKKLPANIFTHTHTYIYIYIYIYKSSISSIHDSPSTWHVCQDNPGRYHRHTIQIFITLFAWHQSLIGNLSIRHQHSLLQLFSFFFHPSIVDHIVPMFIGRHIS